MIIEKVFTLKGEEYHDNKKEIKAIIKKHDLKWKGYYPEIFKWEGTMDSLEANYIKEDMKTVETTLTYKGNDHSDFYMELYAYLKTNVEFTESGISAEKDPEIDYVKIVGSINHELKTMKGNGAPPGFIRLRKIELLEKNQIDNNTWKKYTNNDEINNIS